nr:unnamed protein product [Trichobilharzia regenti]
MSWLLQQRPWNDFELGFLVSLKLLVMPPKKNSKSDTAIVRSMTEMIKDYEHRVEHYETTVCNSIRKCFKKALEEDRPVTRFLVDPQDRRIVEYWDDDRLIEALKEDTDEGVTI